MKESVKKAGRRHPGAERGQGKKALPEIVSPTIPWEAKAKWFPVLIIVLAVGACLIPFSGKAFNIDDPLFLWMADQLMHHPADFYGFRANWFGAEAPAHEIQLNPPLTSYYILLVRWLFGGGEVALHLAFLIPALMAALGAYFLAKKFCARPLAAALVGILSPAFLVSSNTIMSDVIMLSFWVWSVYLWIQGMEQNRQPLLFFSAILIALSTLSKYYGISLVPLLAFYTIHRQRSFDRRILYLIVPLLSLGLYCWMTYNLYGYPHFFKIFSYANEARHIQNRDYLSDTVIGLAFMGGGFISVLFFWPFLWKRATTVIWIILIAGLSALLTAVPAIGQYPLKGNEGFGIFNMIQAALFATVGISIAALAVVDLVRRKDSMAWLLFLWVSGTLFFAFFLNWTVSVRTLLPIAPALGILVMRRFEVEFKPPIQPRSLLLAVPLLLSMILSLSTVWADYCSANTAKQAAREISSKYASTGGVLWFQGHWGFQYYMEKYGGKPVDHNHYRLKAGEILVTPSYLQNANIKPPPMKFMEAVVTRRFESCQWVSIMDSSTGAAFYSSRYGPVPFMFGPTKPLIYEIARFTRTISSF